MNKRNYRTEMDGAVERFRTEGKKPGVLLHTCCAPCASSCMEYLAENCDLTLYYYNPNIDSPEEYEKRASEVKRLIREMYPEGTIRLVIAPWENEAFEKMAEGLENEPERGSRCLKCYEMRLRKTAEAMGGDYDFFATTLTLSPLKSAEAINGIGEKIAAETGRCYLVSDFKKADGFRRSIELSEKYRLYRQNYCGCRFSKRGETNGK